MSSPRNPPLIPLFGQNTDHSFAPAKDRSAIARSGGLVLGQRSEGRPSGRRGSASPLTAASTMAGFRSLRTAMCIVAILAASMLLGGAAHAEQGSSTTRRPNGLTVHPFAAFVIEASRRLSVPEHWIRAVMRAESDGKQRAPSKKALWDSCRSCP
jgi:soluble lytic murein transglycosylase-like protein